MHNYYHGSESESDKEQIVPKQRTAKSDMPDSQSESSYGSKESFSSFKRKFQKRGRTEGSVSGLEFGQLKIKKEDKRWFDKYQKFYKDSKRFNLDLIREHISPFKFKIQFLFPKFQTEDGTTASDLVRDYLKTEPLSLIRIKIVTMKEANRAKVFATVLDL